MRNLHVSDTLGWSRVDLSDFCFQGDREVSRYAARTPRDGSGKVHGLVLINLFIMNQESES